MEWTDERVDTLRRLWGQGISASSIAVELGGVSRNAVIGKVRRLKLDSRGRANNSHGKPQGNDTPKSVKQVPMLAVVSMTAETTPTATTMDYDPTDSSDEVQLVDEPEAELGELHAENAVVSKSRGLQLINLTERTCKWPNGNPLDDNFNFCGDDNNGHGPYCPFHARIAFVPAAKRRRSR